MEQPSHGVWREPRSREWVASMRKYVIGAVIVVAVLATISLTLYRLGSEAYNGFAIAALLTAVMAICLGPFMRSHLEDVSVMPRVLNIYKEREGGHPVKIKVTLNNVEIGRDYGVVEFDGGRLKYTGLRTSFSFSRNFARVVNWTTLYNDTELLFSQVEGEDLVLAVNSISRVDPNNYYSLTPKYRKAIKGWLLEDAEGTETELLPPNRLSFRSDFKSDADHYWWLGSLFLVYHLTEWLARRREPYHLLAYVFPFVVGTAIAMYVARTRNRSAEFLKKYSINNASLSQ